MACRAPADASPSLRERVLPPEPFWALTGAAPAAACSLPCLPALVGPFLPALLGPFLPAGSALEGLGFWEGGSSYSPSYSWEPARGRRRPGQHCCHSKWQVARGKWATKAGAERQQFLPSRQAHAAHAASASPPLHSSGGLAAPPSGVALTRLLHCGSHAALPNQLQPPPLPQPSPTTRAPIAQTLRSPIPDRN